MSEIPSDQPPRAGRPNTFSAEIFEQIIARIACGETLRKICRDNEMPGESTVRGWIVRDEPQGIAAQYARARECQAEAWADEILDDAEDSSRDTCMLMGRNGVEYPAPDHEWIGRSRLRVDTKKWLMARLHPRVYGEKIEQQITGKGGDGPAEITILIDRVNEVKDPNASPGG